MRAYTNLIVLNTHFAHLERKIVFLALDVNAAQEQIRFFEFSSIIPRVRSFSDSLELVAGFGPLLVEEEGGGHAQQRRHVVLVVLVYAHATADDVVDFDLLPRQKVGVQPQDFVVQGRGFHGSLLLQSLDHLTRAHAQTMAESVTNTYHHAHFPLPTTTHFHTSH